MSTGITTISTDNIKIPSALTVGILEDNLNHFYQDDNKSTSCCNKSLIFLVIALGCFLLIGGCYLVISILHSEGMTNTISGIQSFTLNNYDNTKIDPNFLRNLHHQKTAEHFASKRIYKDLPLSSSLVINNNNNNNRSYESLLKMRKHKNISMHSRI